MVSYILIRVEGPVHRDVMHAAQMAVVENVDHDKVLSMTTRHVPEVVEKRFQSVLQHINDN